MNWLLAVFRAYTVREQMLIKSATISCILILGQSLLRAVEEMDC
jgi:hypothetical protein